MTHTEDARLRWAALNIETPPWGSELAIEAAVLVGVVGLLFDGIPGPSPIDGDFFQGWNPLPTAASASGGGLFELNLLHWAANIARGVPRRPGCSYEH